MSERILIVDDDERIRSLLKKYLMRNGFLVSAARDAAHARRLLEGLDFDLIVLDTPPMKNALMKFRSPRATDKRALLRTLSRTVLSGAP